MNTHLLTFSVYLVVGFVGLAESFASGTLPAPEPSPLAAYQALHPGYVPDEVLVKFKAGVSEHWQARSLGRVAERSRRLTESGWLQVRLATGMTVDQALSALRGDRNVAYAQPNVIYEITEVPNDSQYRMLWGLKNRGQTFVGGRYPVRSGTAGADTNLERAWDAITDCSRVRVAVLDTGINYAHLDLASNVWDGGPAYPNHGVDFVDGDVDPMDLNGHGTHVAGIIGAVGNNRLGVTGICWKAQVMAVRVANALGLATTGHLLQGIRFALSHGAKVVYIGVGAAAPFDRALGEAISETAAAGAVVATGAGNGNRDRIGDDNDATGSAIYPCNYSHPNLLCAAALDQNGALASFSNWGAASVDVGAPGTNILSTAAGIRGRLTDAFSDRGALSWTVTGRWNTSTLVLNSGGLLQRFPSLVNPPDFPRGKYANNADERAYKTFDLQGKAAVILTFHTQFALRPDDYFNIGYKRRGGDPFVGGVLVDGISGAGTGESIVGPLAFDITPCASATCSIGFQLLTNASGTDQGVAIIGFTLDTLDLNRAGYHTISGTSMAAAYVAGIAAMLFAYDPQLTAREVVTAIKIGGRKTAALAGKTASGRAVDARGALDYVARSRKGRGK